jgi:hypothetical protein
MAGNSPEDPQLLREEPLLEDGYRVQRHTPGPGQQQGGSWVFDIISRKYHIMSSVSRGGRLTPSPAHPSVFDFVNQIFAQLAKAGHYGSLKIMILTPVPKEYLAPNTVPDSPTLSFKWPESVCRECSETLGHVSLELIAPDAVKQLGEWMPQLDIDMEPSLQALEESVTQGCPLCRFIQDCFGTALHSCRLHYRLR